MHRDPTAGVQFSDVAMMWYMDQTDKLPAPKAENVTFLRQTF